MSSSLTMANNNNNSNNNTTTAAANANNDWRPDYFLLGMYSMRPQLCDVTLITDDNHRIVAHRIVLAASLQYFQAMFVGSPSGGQYVESGQCEIHIRNVDGMALNEIIKWSYTGQVDTRTDNVEQLMSAAKMLDCDHVVAICVQFIESQLHPENALGVYGFAELLGCTDLQEFTMNYIYNNFVAISRQSEEFMQLTGERVAQIISSDLLDTGEDGEQVVLSALIAWILYARTDRMKCLSSLIQHIRFPRFTQESLVRIEDEYPIIKSDATCKDLLIEAMKYHLCNGQISVANNARFRRRKPMGRAKCLLVFGGQSPKAVSENEYYDFKLCQWIKLEPNLPDRRCRAGLAIHNGIVYVIGGFNGQSRINTVDRFDLQHKEWKQCRQMLAKRSTLGVGLFNNMIYAIGGFDGTIGLQSAEVYDPKKDLWQYITPMSTRRSSVGVATLNGGIYAVGGYDGASRQCLSSVEYYNPVNNTWTLICDMSQRRSGAGVGVLDGRLYAIGGHDGPAVRKSVECYDPATNSWYQCADMINARRNAGVVSMDSFLYVIGGDDGQSHLLSVEVYNPQINSWSLLPEEMSMGRSYAGVAIIDKTWT
ncbi:kelch-like protein 3 [Oppia nitens]|uniref:kelch-like protein 3 n=1 Tax=Oppia nitens TaxID=1686743 RepID=UPI0023DABBD9|nr:kelch-like protein 3 [Oppia nitens]